MRSLSGELESKLGDQVTVMGWVNSRRDHGGLIFIDLRDSDGIIQLVITPENSAAFKLAETVRDEFVLSATGIMRERAPELKNPHIKTGNIELVVETLELLNRSETPPVNTHDDGAESGEDLRLKYRYLDLRRPSMQHTLKRRAEFYHALREYMEAHDFTEVTTPILANSSPEGARDFLVPSRIHPGQFYALPQAPQQFKQLLMVGGVPRYYQIAPCFRDEDPRADRLYGDFYQLDLEMSFVDDGEVVRTTVEPLIKQLVTDFAGKTLLYQDVPRLTYTEVMEKYGTDKPDLRYGMELVDLTTALKDTDFKVFQTECVKAICVKNGAALSRSQIDNFTDQAKKLGAGGLAYILYQDGEAKSPIAKFLKPEELATIQQLTHAADGDAVFFGADTREKVNKVLGALRIAFADHFELKNDDQVALLWVTDFPFYEWNDGEQKLDFGHNPFSMPKGGLSALEKAQTDADKLSLTADQYDMVMNGYEICSGAVRNHNPEIMYKVFGILGYSEQYVEERFGGMLSAFKFGAPPHAGCAFGLDRLFMVLNGNKNIRDIVAFPKNGSGVDLMMSSPATVDKKLLDDTSIAVIPEAED
ncbi:aspartate--tRNA ligase [Candidatus Saccharibacteria bacterium]|nr:aspartate--tRNA ligase [Candidatus Saccharibacteria bacterium]